MLKYVVGAVLAAGVATPALAQDAAPFTGPRIEALVGWDHVKVSDESDNGIAFGVGLGYDFQLGGAVVGIEAEAADSSTKDCVNDVFVLDDALCVKSGRDLYAGARVGGVVGANTLLYAKAGYTNARVVVSYDDGVDEENDGANLDGFRVGAGLEHKFGGNTFLKAEYRYSNYEADVERHQVVAGVGFRF